MSRIVRLALLALFVFTLLPVAACETDTSPAQMGDNPPPPPTRTPTGLRHGPNTGVHMMSNELTPEEAAALGNGQPEESDETPSEETNDEKAKDEAGREATATPSP